MRSRPSASDLTRSGIVLDTVLVLIRPLVRLLLRHGIAYPALAAALKQVFLAAARDELAARRMPATDSALSLLSGVHRRDVRTLSRAAPAPARGPSGGLAAEVVARWLSEPAYLDAGDHPRPLPRTGAEPSFETLVQSISTDVRPRAVLDELIRLGVADSDDTGGSVRLLAEGFAPRQGFEALAGQLRGNLHDHLACASANLDADANFLEQSLYVDEITEASAQHLHRVAAQAWRQAFRTVMREAQTRFDDDARHAPADQRQQRARFGAYFFHTDDRPSHD